MPRRSVAGSVARVSTPSMVTVPDVGSIIRLTIRSEVVLPQPDGPTSTVIRPVGAVRVSPSTATVPPAYLLVSASKRIMSCLRGSGTRLQPSGSGVQR